MLFHSSCSHDAENQSIQLQPKPGWSQAIQESKLRRRTKHNDVHRPQIQGTVEILTCPKYSLPCPLTRCSLFVSHSCAKLMNHLCRNFKQLLLLRLWGCNESATTVWKTFSAHARIWGGFLELRLATKTFYRPLCCTKNTLVRLLLRYNYFRE